MHVLTARRVAALPCGPDCWSMKSRSRSRPARYQPTIELFGSYLIPGTPGQAWAGLKNRLQALPKTKRRGHLSALKVRFLAECQRRQLARSCLASATLRILRRRSH